MELNGGSVVAMVGKDCVAIASDLRLGNQAVGIAANFDKVSETSVPAGEITTDFDHS
jgi:20S proteasome subunit beta 3